MFNLSKPIISQDQILLHVNSKCLCDTSKTLSDITINMKRKNHYPKTSAICLCSCNKVITSVTNTND